MEPQPEDFDLDFIEVHQTALVVDGLILSVEGSYFHATPTDPAGWRIDRCEAAGIEVQLDARTARAAVTALEHTRPECLS